MDADRLAALKERAFDVPTRIGANDARALVAEVERLQAENGLLRRSLEVLANRPGKWFHA